MKYLLLTLIVIACSTTKKQPVKHTLCTMRIWQIGIDTLYYYGDIPCDYFIKNK